jgi:hypothetical protein
MPEEDGPMGAGSRRGQRMPTAQTIYGHWDGGSQLGHSHRVKAREQGMGG